MDHPHLRQRVVRGLLVGDHAALDERLLVGGGRLALPQRFGRVCPNRDAADDSTITATSREANETIADALGSALCDAAGYEKGAC